MSRHILSLPPDRGHMIRRQVSFVRRDLLLDGETCNPETGEFVSLPVRGENGLIGPGVGHTLVRSIVETLTLAPHHRSAAAEMNGGILPRYAAMWTLLETANLWRTEE